MPINKGDTTEIAVSRQSRHAVVIMLRRDKQEATNCLQTDYERRILTTASPPPRLVMMTLSIKIQRLIVAIKYIPTI